MQIIKDDPAYAGLQHQFVRTLASDVRDTLRDAAECGATFEEAVTAITVKVAMILDGTRPIDHDGSALVPVLALGMAGAGEAQADLLSTGARGTMHEQAIEAVEVLLAEATPAAA